MLTRIRIITITAAWLSIMLSSSSLADEGMWLLNKLPSKLLSEKYGFKPDNKWLDHVQKSCVRFSSGGSGSIISADGLVMTNHHVGSDCLEQLSTPENNLLINGFYAQTREQELKCTNLELMVLWTIDDVTERVNGATTQGMSPSDANAARRKMMTTIEDEAEKKTKLDCQVVTLWQGGRYHLYSYKRYDDIRLVMAPEESIAFFGGDNDNFEYPRFDLDMCFFRIYENGKPLKPEHFLKWSPAGGAENELALVCGHPGRTQRLNTVDHLKFLRDVETPATLRHLWRREVRLHTFAGRSDENARIANGDIRGVENSRKAVTGVMAGLLDPAFFRQKAESEKKLRAAVESNSQYREQWGDAWDRIAAAQQIYRGFFDRYQLLEGRRGLRSDLFDIAKKLVRLAQEKPKLNAERLREFRDSELDSLFLDLYSTAPIYDDLEIERLSSGLSLMAEILGGEDPLVVRALDGLSPQARAESLVRGSSLRDVAKRKALAEGGAKAIAESKDPLIRFAAALDPDGRQLRKRYEDEVESVERLNYAKVAAAQFAIEGENSYPDATFTLRLAFGPIKGYQENGRPVAPFTTVGGAFAHMHERNDAEPFLLPQRWLDRESRLDLSTPFNFVCTADIIGGNSGSPVINTKGELIGLIFDGNIQSLIADLAYTDEQGRAVAVDSRSIIECLRKLYDAGKLADEIVGK